MTKKKNLFQILLLLKHLYFEKREKVVVISDMSAKVIVKYMDEVIGKRDEARMVNGWWKSVVNELFPINSFLSTIYF